MLDKLPLQIQQICDMSQTVLCIQGANSVLVLLLQTLASSHLPRLPPVPLYKIHMSGGRPLKSNEQV